MLISECNAKRHRWFRHFTPNGCNMGDLRRFNMFISAFEHQINSNYLICFYFVYINIEKILIKSFFIKKFKTGGIDYPLGPDDTHILSNTTTRFVSFKIYNTNIHFSSFKGKRFSIFICGRRRTRTSTHQSCNSH